MLRLTPWLSDSLRGRMNKSQVKQLTDISEPPQLLGCMWLQTLCSDRIHISLRDRTHQKILMGWRLIVGNQLDMTTVILVITLGGEAYDLSTFETSGWTKSLSQVNQVVVAAAAVHAFIPSTWVAEAGRSLGSRTAWSRKQVPAYPELLQRNSVSKKS